MEELRQELLNTQFNQMIGAMGNVSPEQMQAMKDMFNALNRMLEQREAGEPNDRRSNSSWSSTANSSPKPADARRVARADGAADGADAGDAQLDDARAAGAAAGPRRSAHGRHGPALQVEPLVEQPAAGVPGRGLGRALQLPGPGPARLRPGGATAATNSATSTRWRTCCAGASPGALADVDMDRAAELLGADSARSLERLAELAKTLEQAGLIEQKEGRSNSRPRACAGSAATRCATCSRSWPRTAWARTRSTRSASVTSAASRPSSTSSATTSTSTSRATVGNAIRRNGARLARAAHARGLRDRAHRDDDAVGDGADGRPVAVDADARQLPRGEEGRDGVALADLLAVPPRLPRHRRLLRSRARAQARAPARGVVGLRVRHEHAARVPAGAAAAGAADRARSRSS